MSSMTKDELRGALEEAGVGPLPPLSAKKEELVSLYRQHLAPKLELSDDEEGEVEFSGDKSKSSNNASEIDVTALSDDDLFLQLKSAGVDVGPIVSSTRQFYERKLASILSGPAETVGNSSREYSDTEPEDDDEDDQPSAVVSPSQLPEKRVTRSSTTSPKSPVESLGLGGGLRQRLVQDEADGERLSSSFRTELESGTVSPRRSIHSYKVTEVRRETVRRDREGVETRDSFHTVEREEGGGEGSSKPAAASRPRSWMSLLVKVLLLVLVCLGAFLVVTYQQEAEDPAAQVMQALQGEGEGPRESPPVEEAPVQGSLGDV